jgi:hypothetical protein
MSTIAHGWLSQQDPDAIRETLRAVFEIEHDGQRWVFASDGVVMLAERSADAPAEPWAGKTPPVNTIFGERGWIDLKEHAVADLRAFAGEPAPLEPPQRCVLCDGTGSVLHRCDCCYCTELDEECPDCDGEGKAIPERAERRGWLGEALVDLDRLHSALAAFPVERASVGLIPAGGGYRIVLDAGTRRALVMSLRFDDEDNPARWPRFNAEVPA